MSSFVQIANLAGTLIGTQANIVDPSDNRLLARTVRQAWDLQRRAAIRDGDWNFASRRAQLAALANPGTINPWGYAYQLPAEALRLIELIDDPDRDRYALDGKQILTNASAPLAIRYCIDVPEPAEWDEMFADAFAKRLAVTIGKKIAGSAYDATQGWQIYKDALSSAKSVDARENPPLEQEESDWVLARFAYDYRVPQGGPYNY